MKPENVKSGFRRTGIYPFNPLAYLKTVASHNKPTSLTLLPPLLSPSLAVSDLQHAPVLSELVRSPSLTSPPPASATPRPVTKKRVRRTLDTSAGVLLTGDGTRALLRAAAEAAEEVERVKRQKVEDRLAKRAEKEKEAAEKQAARLVKQAERTAEAAAKALAKEEKRRRKAEEAAAASEDKENVDPNASAVVRAAPKPARYVCSVVSEGRRVLLLMKKSV